MSQLSVGKLLPNLKVTLGNDHADTDSSYVKEMSIDSKVEIVGPTIDNLTNPKVYINRDGGFATGIDLLEQENSGILSKRAERFGLNTEESKPSISSLYESMGIDVKNRDSPKMRDLRLHAIHVRGLEELCTEEVFNYFKEYGPLSIEWINDFCCNVLWYDESSCARALLGLSKPLPVSLNAEIYKAIAQSDDPDIATLKLTEVKDNEEMEVDSISEVDLNIPIPPGRWRLGIGKSKAQIIVLRFATKGDKKVPGAEKRSNFYKKYGNPNYGGLKGLISSSRKNKAQAAANRWAVQKGSSFKSSLSSNQSVTYIPKTSKPKKFRMRMYADDEELKTKKIRSKGSFYQRKSNVHSRLGQKYTSDDLCHLGSYVDLDRNDDDDDVREYEYDYKEKSSSVDLRTKLKNLRKNHQETYAGQNNRNSDRGSIKSYKRVYDLKKERSFYKRKHRSPLCADDDDDDTETSSSEE